jgi:hypothetical protein
MRSTLAFRFVVGAVCLASVACTASLDLDRFRSDGKPAQARDATFEANYHDFRFSALGMVTHLDEHFELRILDKNNQVVTKAVFDSITSERFSLFLGSSIPRQVENRPYRVDFWADHNNKDRTKPMTYEEPPPGALIDEKDHAWRQILREAAPPEGNLVDSRYEINFQHNTNFTNILTGADNVTKVPEDVSKRDCRLAVALDAQFAGKMFELRISSKDDGHLAGLWRQGRATELVKVDLRHILDEGGYMVSAFIDEDGNGEYDTGEPSWMYELESTADENHVFELNTVILAQTPIDTGERP